MLTHFRDNIYKNLLDFLNSGAHKLKLGQYFFLKKLKSQQKFKLELFSFAKILSFRIFSFSFFY